MAEDHTPIKRWPPAIRLAVAVGISVGLWVVTAGVVWLMARAA